jgi:acyl-CoA dehydrogenase
MAATRETDHVKALRDFDVAFFGHVSFTLSNVVRSVVYGITGGAVIAKPRTAYAPLHAYYRAATRLSTAFALLADVSMFVLGGDLKRRERISGRLGDVLSQLYLISATLKRFEDEGRQQEDLPLVRWGVEDALVKAQHALDGVLANYPNRVVAGLVRGLAFPFGLPYREPSDRLGSEIAELMQTPGAARERLVSDSYVPHPDVDALGYGELVFELNPRFTQIDQKLRDAVSQGLLAPMPQSLAQLAAWTDTAQKQGLIDVDDRRVLDDYARYGAQVVKVDDFPADFDMLAGLQQRKETLERALELAT